MTDQKPPPAKVVSMCGRPIDPAVEGTAPDDETAAARRQLTHWSSCATSYVGLFLTEDGVAFSSSSEDAGRILQLVTLLKSRADAYAIAQLCDECGLEPDDEDDDDE